MKIKFVGLIALILAFIGLIDPAGAEDPARKSALPIYLEQSITDTASTPAALTNNLVDGSFEMGALNGSWNEQELTFSSPICSFATCGDGATGLGENTAQDGTHWVWFGGVNSGATIGQIDQDVIIDEVEPACSTVEATTHLCFYMWNQASDGSGFIEVQMDGQADRFNSGTTVYSYLDGSDEAYQSNWEQVCVDLSDYADGTVHNIAFYADTPTGNGSLTNIFIDNVTLVEDNGASQCIQTAVEMSDIGVTTNTPLTLVLLTVTTFTLMAVTVVARKQPQKI